MEESNSNLLQYGFSSINEEIAKDQLFEPASTELSNSTAEPEAVLQNVNPAVILAISSNNTPSEPAHTEVTDQPQSATQVVPINVSKPKPPSRSRKRKAGKSLRDENAPRMPQTGYVMYMNERRDAIKAVTPNISFSDLTKTIAAEWSSMDIKQKRVYLDIAEENKAKYLGELAIYQQSEAYKLFQDKKLESTVTGNSKSLKPSEKDAKVPVQSKEAPVKMPGMDIPIFTEDFLEHNKNREKELRELRKLNYQYEEQNAILSTHVDELKKIVSSLEEEANLQRSNNIALVQHLESLRDTLASNFAKIPLPGTDELPTVANIDTYMTKLHQLILDAPQVNEDLIVAVREVVNKLNLEAYVG